MPKKLVVMLSLLCACLIGCGPKTLEEKAEAGDADAQYNLGWMYEYGKGVPQDYKEAARWYRKAADQGHALAQHNLGVMYLKGDGVPEDDKEAIKWYRLAADQGHADAQYNLGNMYSYPQGVPQDYKEAIKWYRLAADQGHADAQFDLGAMYDFGRGVPQDYKEAVKWWRLAADQGIIGAQLNLGVRYAKGRGVTQDHKEAVKWYRLAADQGHVVAQSELATAYKYGRGVPQDLRESAKWNRLAAEQGDAGAQFGVGWRYRMGWGVPQDYVQAYAWYNLASANEFSPAKTLKDSLAEKMTPDQIARAQELSRKLLTKPSSKASEEGGIASGTGWFTTTGHIVTCYHVIEGRANISYAFEDGIKNKARVVFKDVINDIAILKSVENQKFPKGLPVARRTSIGTQVFTLGFPHVDLLGKSPKLTNGIISATTGLQDDPRVLQISVPVQSGNSGGPLLNMRGEVVGIVVGGLNAAKVFSWTGDLPQNVNYAIKSSYIFPLLDELDPSKARAKEFELSRLAPLVQPSVVLIIAE